jgi:hypothetical protein
MYNYSFGEVCNIQLMLGSDLRNSTITADEEGVIEQRTFLSTGIGYSDCKGTAISTSVMYVLEEYAASAFFSVQEWDVVEDLCKEKFYNSTVIDYIYSDGMYTEALYVLGNSYDDQRWELEGSVTYAEESSVTENDIYNILIKSICYYASPTWQDPLECNVCTYNSLLDALTIATLHTYYSFTFLVLVIQIVYPKVYPHKAESTVKLVQQEREEIEQTKRNMDHRLSRLSMDFEARFKPKSPRVNNDSVEMSPINETGPI